MVINGTGATPGMEARPILVISPRHDIGFVRAAEGLVDEGERVLTGLQGRLSKRYPAVIVRARDLSGEPETWYVFRDGHWMGDAD